MDKKLRSSPEVLLANDYIETDKGFMNIIEKMDMVQSYYQETMVDIGIVRLFHLRFSTK